ncbi:MAG TPA: methyltransferase domain-containing protein, partial [Hyphomicrobiaceae bacterium]|nr:methyltransferase domain-containing protein [Hyphomicrobiaceae bacterium]
MHDTPPKHFAEPSPFVARWLEGVGGSGTVLDVACGGGRHLRLALARGHRVTGVDRDISGVADLAAEPRATIIEADLEGGAGLAPHLAGHRFDGVIVANYLWRPILGDIIAAVSSA